ncbi:HlyC/CorC family transporter [Amnimonas aquatica]|uniref:Magnesium and cobalt efflux protein CorC n=1 Tax=Amnimonas aquatica TaxID=2094561 RepID=A0A2P6AT69_9GAMM|nr:transporter associated domain-containing protein [Amnimonas aquatica]PQA45346.1 magnesium/cobalt efflux protein [Amnimonas aquatica]
MSEGRSPGDSPKSWFSRLTEAWSGEITTREELVETIRDAVASGLLDVEAQRIIESTLQVSERQVRDIMVPRAQMFTIRAGQSLKDILPELIETAHSRFPVLAEDNPDEVLGILFAKDLLRLLLEPDDDLVLTEHLRPAFFVPESTHLDKLIREFRAKKSHMAVVVNEYGGIAGLVTLEDALEQIVGEIDDEHDEDDADEDLPIRESGPDEWVVQALTPITDFNAYFGSRFSDEDFDTIAGIILNAFERLPETGEQIELERWRFTILAADSRTIRLLRVERRK